MTMPLDLSTLESHLWEAANILRGPVDAADFKTYIFPLLFFKRISDVYDEEVAQALEESGGDEDYALFPENHRFQIPKGCHWQDIRARTANVGQALQRALREIEKANPRTLYSIFGDAPWSNKERLSDELLCDLIEHFSQLSLTNQAVESDVLGQAYEYLIKKFADATNKKAGEFYTPRSIVRLMINILDPREGETIYDPACGTGGMLLEAVHHVKESNGNAKTLWGKLYGQEKNLTTSAIARINLFLHGVEVACRQNRLNLLNASLPVDENNIPIDLPRMLEEKHIEGLLLVGTFVDATLDHLLGEKSIPVVLVDAYSESNGYDAVLSENFQGAYRAVSYLIEKGHRHIGLAGTTRRAYPSVLERRRGYLEALQDHGIAETYFADCIPRHDESHLAAKQLLAKNPQITALFGANDRVAIAAMHAAFELGKRVPDDLSLIGFDDIDLAHLVTPSLTTMQVDKISLGRLAVQMLLNRVQMPTLPPTVTALRTRLIERQSVKNIR
jgi:DNA-binding LacI/PurR family transcriptional regulator